MRQTMLCVLLIVSLFVDNASLNGTCFSRFDFDEKIFLTLLRIERKMEKFEKHIPRMQKTFDNDESSRYEKLSRFLYERKKEIKMAMEQLSTWEDEIAKGILLQKSTALGKI